MRPAFASGRRGIANARARIYLAALYLQDDTAGREIMDALYAAHRRRPSMEIVVFVDWHRAQRGLIGKDQNANNAAMYREYATRLGSGVKIYGVPVQTRELFGVQHLKGFVIDDTVIYSGASLNDVYLARHGRYRLDRYHLIRDQALADSMVEFLRRLFFTSDAVRALNQGDLPATRSLRTAIRGLRAKINAHTKSPPPRCPRDVGIAPLAGFGRSDSAQRRAGGPGAGTTHKLTILTPISICPRCCVAPSGSFSSAGAA